MSKASWSVEEAWNQRRTRSAFIELEIAGEGEVAVAFGREACWGGEVVEALSV